MACRGKRSGKTREGAFVEHLAYVKYYASPFWASQVALVVKNQPADAKDARDMSSVPGLERFPGGVCSNSLQYSCLENPMDSGTWQATVHGITESDRTE